jgi:glycosyltransferase involved in cell wall biosynthesis
VTGPTVVHLTSVHAPLDTRILYRECRTLADAGYRVVLVAPGDRDADVAGVHVRAVRGNGGRARRMTKTVWRVCRAALEERAAIYHLHDPELLQGVPFLRRNGARVVYDVHEDLPRQVRSKYWIAPWARSAVSSAAGLGEALLGRGAHAIVAATPQIAARFPPDRTVILQNFPREEELLAPTASPLANRGRLLAYIGGIDITRGALEMVRAMAMVPGARLLLAGRMGLPGIERQLAALPGWDRVDFLGWLDREGVRTVLGQARIGLVTLHPTPSYVESYPVKLFEYMAAGIPVVASDFPLWRGIIEEAGCGLLVDPERPEAIAEAVNRLLNDQALAAAMGQRGQAAVRERYNWGSQEGRLLGLYRRLSG